MTRTDSKRDSWNRRYAESDRIPAPAPSRFLVAEVEGLAPARALDLACGSGRNAVWLAEQGWRVTAVDFSEVGLGVARNLAASRGASVHWVEADVTEWIPPVRAYELVCVLYMQLPAVERRLVLGRAADAVAPGGTMLVLGHDLLNLTEGWAGPKYPEVLFTPDDVAKEIGGLSVEKAMRVKRPVEDGGVVHEAIDALVRARRSVGA